MRLFIITGTSRGLGQAIASQALSEGGAVHGIARHGNGELRENATESSGKLVEHTADLSAVDRLPELAGEIAGSADWDNVEGLVLVNNAGLLEPMGPVSELQPQELEKHITVNVTALMQLTGSILALTKEAPYPRTVINISSGAAQTPYYGWAPYCVGKAAVEMFTRVTALEYSDDPKVRVLSVAPGVVDTGMQATIRATDERRFPNREKFIQLKESGKLYTPAHAARLVLRAAYDETIASGESVDVRSHYRR